MGEVTVLGLVKGTAFNAGNATLEPDTVAERFFELYRSRSSVYLDVA